MSSKAELVMHRSIPAVTIPPWADPRDLYFFFHGTTNSPPPGRQKLQITHPRATEKQQKLLT